MTGSSERARAERGLDIYRGEIEGDRESIEWPSAKERIRQARLDAGLTEAAVAQVIEATIHYYWDLEHFDDEVFTVPSLRELKALGDVLNVEPRVLLIGPEECNATQILSFRSIREHLADHLARNGITVDQFSDAIGWDMTPLMTDPEVLWTWNVEALYSITKPLGLDWVAALPTLDADDE